jgi:hypothetical protein
MFSYMALLQIRIIQIFTKCDCTEYHLAFLSQNLHARFRPNIFFEKGTVILNTPIVSIFLSFILCSDSQHFSQKTP